MKIRTNSKITLRRWRMPVAGLIFAALAAGCAKEQSGEAGAGGTVKARITLSADTFGEIDVRSADDAIKNVWVIQLNSAGTAQLQAPQYITSVAPSGSDYVVSANLTAQASKVYFIANTNDASAFTSANTSAKVEGVYKRGTTFTDAPMSGLWTGTPGNTGIPDKVSLVRSVAKLSINFKTELPAGDSFTNGKIYLVTRQSNTYYYRNPSQALPYPTSNFDANEVSYLFASFSGTSGIGTTYVPENARGKGTGTKETEKDAAHAPDAYCTYIRVEGTYTASSGTATNISSNIYLGANNIDDYNVVRNKVYTLNITIKGSGPIIPDNSINYTDGGQPWFLVASADLPGKMTYQQATGSSPGDAPDFNAIRPDMLNSYSIVTRAAVGACPDGWRVPSNNELMLMYIYSKAIGNFEGNTEATGEYWSNYPWALFNMYTGSMRDNPNASLNLYVRCIREI